jgi:F0F1-type ATP synthase membrane subunit b/b'
MTVARMLVVAASLVACSPSDGVISERCQRIIQADAEARAALEEAQERGAPEAELRRLRVAFGREHDALFDSGCLKS